MGFEDGAKGADFDIHRSSRHAGSQTPRLIGADVVRRNIANQLCSKNPNQGLERVLVQFAGIARAITKPKEIPLFKIAAERLIQEKRARRARKTGELYKYALKPLVRVFGTKLVCDISPDDIRAYQTRRLTTGVSARTVNI